MDTKPARQHRFLAVFGSDLNLGDSVIDATLNLGRREIRLSMTEKENFQVLDWMLAIPPDESLTLMITDKNNHVCQVAFTGLMIVEHNCLLLGDKLQKAFGIDTPDEEPVHDITLSYNKVERLKNFKL